MSRVGKKPIPLPDNVTVAYQERRIALKGPKGENSFLVPPLVELKIEEQEIRVEADYLNNKRARSLMGTVRSVIQNMVTGVSQGFTRQLRMVGVGYRASVAGTELELLVGFSKPVRLPLPQGVTAAVEGNTQINLASHDNVLLGRFAAQIRSVRPPEPYQGKGILYAGEKVRRKAGKAGKK